MQYSSRFWLYAPFALVLILAAGVMLVWWQAAGRLEKSLAAIKGQHAVPGLVLDWTQVEVGGFPFRLDANFTGLRISGAGAHGPFAWETERFALHALTYSRAKTVYEAAGRQRLDWTAGDGSSRTIAFAQGSLHASSVTDDQGLARFDLDIAHAVGESVLAERFQFHIRRDAQDIKLMVRADAVRAGTERHRLVQAYASLNRPDVLAPLLAGQMPWPAAVMLWRANGGQASVTQTSAPDMAEAILSSLY